MLPGGSSSGGFGTRPYGKRVSDWAVAGLKSQQEGAMKQRSEFLIKVVLMVVIWIAWWWAIQTPLSPIVNVWVMVGGLLLVFPLIWLSRKMLERRPTASGAAWITTFVHFGLGFLLGIPIFRAVLTHQDWVGWTLPVPPSIGLALVVLSAAAFLLTVVNLALKGSGAPFFIALSEKLAVDWLYAWTRNPMVLAGLAFLVSLGIWYQSALFVLWTLGLFTPALLFFIKFYEELELELRFGTSYLEYKAKKMTRFSHGGRQTKPVAE
jgi:protein-S-isoprenylcysteine O-methyltransferase Ste14